MQMAKVHPRFADSAMEPSCPSIRRIGSRQNDLFLALIPTHDLKWLHAGRLQCRKRPGATTKNRMAAPSLDISKSLGNLLFAGFWRSKSFSGFESHHFIILCTFINLKLPHNSLVSRIGKRAMPASFILVTSHRDPFFLFLFYMFAFVSVDRYE